ncbi:zinc finger MYM-type protein 1 [Trichonephila clavipes]|nr:zinc finger MYM-type protein 1 [Trichonephila clavipes]
MGIPYHPGIKATVDGMATPILSRQGQIQTNAVKAQDYGNSVLVQARCFAGGPYATRNNYQFRCLLRNSTEAPKIVAKQTARHAVKRKENKSVLDKQSKEQLRKDTECYHNVLKRIAALVKYLAIRGIAFRGTEEVLGSHNGNFMDALELLAEIDPFIREHIEQRELRSKSLISYLPKTIYDQIMEIIGKHKSLKQLQFKKTWQERIRCALLFATVIKRRYCLTRGPRLTECKGRGVRRMSMAHHSTSVAGTQAAIGSIMTQ